MLCSLFAAIEFQSLTIHSWQDSAPKLAPSSKARSLLHLFSGAGKNDYKSVKRVTGCPLTLVCSLSFQIFPWELILGEVVVRQLSLWDALDSSVQGKGPLPLFVGVYFSQVSLFLRSVIFFR
jgi:hypothetical protein